MTKQSTDPRGEHVETQMDLRHLRRQTQTALELALVALAPTALADRLAAVTGWLEALVELPNDSPPVLALVPGIVTRARSALVDWEQWQRDYLEKRIPRG